MTIERIRQEADVFQHRIWWRNVREYGAIAIVVIAFGLYFKWFPNPVARVGSAMVIGGALYVAYQLHRRASSETMPAGDALENCLGFHRHELERQRDALQSVWRWSLVPLIPGLAVFVAGLAVQVPIGPLRARIAFSVASLAVVGGIFWLVAKWSRNAARKLQTEIDNLRAIEP